MDKHDILYGVDGHDHLSLDLYECMLGYLEQLNPAQIKEIGTVTVYVYRRVTARCPTFAQDIVDDLLERLDVEYGNPDGGGGAKATKKMLKAAEALIKTVEDEYIPWVCERTGETVRIDAVEWCRWNEPQLLEDEG